MPVFSPNLPHFHFKTEILSFHPVFDIEGQLSGSPDILFQFFPDRFSFKIKEMRGIDGKGGIPGRDLGIDQLFCLLDLRGDPRLYRDMICMKGPDVKLYSLRGFSHLF